MGSTTVRDRPIRVANCSGSAVDPGDFMFYQARDGPVDAITGDYLAEMNLAAHAEKYKAGEHPGYEKTGLDGIRQSLDLINERRIKIVLNAGSLNPKGLAVEVQKLVQSKSYDLTVAYVFGDDLMSRVKDILDPAKGPPPHLDSETAEVKLVKNTDNFLSNPDKPIVSANAYLGARAITRGLAEGADIIICGRVADASPVIGLAQWWHGWGENALDELGGALLAGHLIECSAYATGANFSGFEKYRNEELMNMALPIAEINVKGESVITRHEARNGIVTEDTIRAQLLYEIQGHHYINSDVKADLSQVVVKEIGKNRVSVTGVKGLPPPPTTKFAIFYKAGFQCELSQNATGTRASIPRKFQIVELQVRDRLKTTGVLDKIDILEFQHIGMPEDNPRSQLRGTTQLRVFAQAEKKETLFSLLKEFMYNGMQHFSGAHGTLDQRAAMPIPFLGYYPGLVAQEELDEGVFILDKDATAEKLTGRELRIQHPRTTEPIGKRISYEPTNPVHDLAAQFGETRAAPLGDVVLGRSGDKGANVNIGLYVHTDEEWDWLRSLLTSTKMRELMGEDWKEEYYIERVEFPNIKAVHFVIYGPLGRGISSSALLDGLGKGFADYIRSRYVDIPVKFLK